MTDKRLPLWRRNQHPESVVPDKRRNAFKIFFFEMLRDIHLYCPAKAD